MNINLIAVGDKMPDWVSAGFSGYQKRLNQEVKLNLIAIHAQKRGKKMNPCKVVAQEGEQILKAIPKNNTIIALEVGGKSWSTEQLAQKLRQWLGQGQDIALLIGGPEGLSDACRQCAREQWSLSPLTLPHPLVRIIVAEQLFRAWSLLHHHPYHRT